MNQVISSHVVNTPQVSITYQDDNTHKKLSAFFLNVEKALARGPDAELYEARLRSQLYSIISENGIGELFDWGEARLITLIKKELESGMFYNVDPNDMQGGFTMDDFNSENEPADALLCIMREQMHEVRSGVFKEFCYYYRIVKANPSNHLAYIQMQNLLSTDLMKLGYFNWLRCRDKWAQEMVNGAKERWIVTENFHFAI